MRSKQWDQMEQVTWLVGNIVGEAEGSKWLTSRINVMQEVA
jgi:hypothetical protein